MKKKLVLALCLSSCLSFAQFISTAAGNGTGGFSGNGGQATSAELYHPLGVAFDAAGNMYIADSDNLRIRKVSTNGVISTVAGNGAGGFSGDGGQATSAGIEFPTAIAFDAAGNMYIADEGNNRIRKVTTAGVISTFAGNGTAGFSGDGGAATSAELSAPYDIAFDASGNLYIADYNNNRIRMVNTSGNISTVAGNGTAGFSGDGSAATSAKLNGPIGISFDASGNMYIADLNNHRIRLVNTSGNISTVAGNGTAGFSGDGAAATSAKLNGPEKVAFDASGNMYISDYSNYRVRRVNTSGNISTYVGNGTGGYSGDGGSAGSAEIFGAHGLAFNSAGNLYIADPNNERIRIVAVYCPVNAGSNQTNYQDYCGHWTPGVTIGTLPSISGITYGWSPTTSLNPTNTATTTCTTSSTITYTLTASGTGCTSKTSTVTVTAVTTTCQACCREMNPALLNQPQVNFSVYPNPSNSQITVSLYDKAEYIRILDLSGRVIFEIKDGIDSDIIFDVSKYAKGVYLVIAKIGDKLEKQKLIID